MANVLHTLSSKVKSLTDRDSDKEKNGSTSPPSSSNPSTRRSLDLSRTSIDAHRNSLEGSRRSNGSGAFLSDHHIHSASLSSLDKAHGKHPSRVGTLKSAGIEVASKLHLSHHRSSSSDLAKNGEADEMSKNQIRKREKQVETLRRKEVHKAEDEDIVRRKEEEQKIAERDDPPEMLARYGTLPHQQLCRRVDTYEPRQATGIHHRRCWQRSDFQGATSQCPKNECEAGLLHFAATDCYDPGRGTTIGHGFKTHGILGGTPTY